jgi:hypothetical protein
MVLLRSCICGLPPLLIRISCPCYSPPDRPAGHAQSMANGMGCTQFTPAAHMRPAFADAAATLGPPWADGHRVTCERSTVAVLFRDCAVRQPIHSHAHSQSVDNSPSVPTSRQKNATPHTHVSPNSVPSEHCELDLSAEDCQIDGWGGMSMLGYSGSESRHHGI